MNWLSSIWLLIWLPSWDLGGLDFPAICRSYTTIRAGDMVVTVDVIADVIETLPLSTCNKVSRYVVAREPWMLCWVGIWSQYRECASTLSVHMPVPLEYRDGFVVLQWGIPQRLTLQQKILTHRIVWTIYYGKRFTYTPFFRTRSRQKRKGKRVLNQEEFDMRWGICREPF